MGRTRVIPTIIVFDRVLSTDGKSWREVRWTSQAWRREYGRPTEANLAKVIQSLESSTAPGGANAHLGITQVAAARIVRQRDGKVLAIWQPRPFGVLGTAPRANPADDREDVTARRMQEANADRVKIGPSLTATERALLDKLPPELEIGFISKALLYAPAIRHAAYTKPERTALFKLLKRGLLRVERDRRRDMEYLVKVQSAQYQDAERSGLLAQRYSEALAKGATGQQAIESARRSVMTRKLNPKVTVFHANPKGRRVIPFSGGSVLQSTRVFEIAYKHVQDGDDYIHKFRRGVCLELLPDGSLRIYSHDGKRLWKSFNMKD